MPTFKSYVTGFFLSIVLTLGAYFVVTNHVSNGLLIILILAIVQLFVQLIFFLHVGKGQDGHWNLVVLFSTASIVLILVVGTLWIMNHLNYNMTPQQMNASIMKMEGMHESTSDAAPVQRYISGIKNLPADILPEQIYTTYIVNGVLYAFAVQPDLNSYVPELEGKMMAWHGVLRSQDNGQRWTKFFTIINPPNDGGGGLSYNPRGIFSENNKIYVDIVNERGAGSGEGELIRFSTIDNGKTWQRNKCYSYIPESYYLDYDIVSNGHANLSTIRPHNLKLAQEKCVY